MNNLTICENRLKTMLAGDKQENPQRIERVLKSEILYVLKNYFEICSEDLNVEILVNEQGRYELNIHGLSRAIKIAHTFG